MNDKKLTPIQESNLVKRMKGYLKPKGSSTNRKSSYANLNHRDYVHYNVKAALPKGYTELDRLNGVRMQTANQMKRRLRSQGFKKSKNNDLIYKPKAL